MKKITAIFIIIIAICTITLFYLHHPLNTRIQIQNQIFTVELAVTQLEKERGLGYRDSLDEHLGMLFPYDHSERYSFWMKGMRFPIDIIWINDNKIVDISKNVPVSTNSILFTYAPKEPVNQVLELNAGVSNRYNFQIGDSVTILK
jgi:uncharacterized membrane protein (UPF0127 family)